MITAEQIAEKIDELKTANNAARSVKRGMNLENRAAVDKFISINRRTMDLLAFNFNVVEKKLFNEVAQDQALEQLKKILDIS